MLTSASQRTNPTRTPSTGSRRRICKPTWTTRTTISGTDLTQAVSWTNSSSRAQQITDVRAQPNGTTYVFTYNNDAIPHLTYITANVPTGEGGTFTYATGQGLYEPFGNSPYGTTTYLASTPTPTSLPTTYAYDTSGELTEVTFPL